MYNYSRLPSSTKRSCEISSAVGATSKYVPRVLMTITAERFTPTLTPGMGGQWSHAVGIWKCWNNPASTHLTVICTLSPRKRPVLNDTCCNTMFLNSNKRWNDAHCTCLLGADDGIYGRSNMADT